MMRSQKKPRMFLLGEADAHTGVSFELSGDPKPRAFLFSDGLKLNIMNLFMTKGIIISSLFQNHPPFFKEFLKEKATRRASKCFK